MSTRVFVPNDTAARSLGADAVAEAVAAETARRGLANACSPTRSGPTTCSSTG